MSSSAGPVAVIVMTAGIALLYLVSKIELPGQRSLSRVTHRRAPDRVAERTIGGLGRFARERTGQPPKLG
jgi:hypothetical protein